MALPMAISIGRRWEVDGRTVPKAPGFPLTDSLDSELLFELTGQYHLFTSFSFGFGCQEVQN
jgi:hypothetical protein